MNKGFYFSVFALSLLSACGGSSILEKITGEREPQAVSGARRAPALNNVAPAPYSSANSQSFTQQVASAPPASQSPFDSYDSNGNKTSGGSSTDQQSGAQSGNLFTRVFGGDSAPSSASNVRKPFAASPYSPETTSTAPIAIASSSEVPKLSTVPSKSPRFEEVKQESKQNMAELKTSHTSSTKDKAELDSEVAATASSDISAPTPAASALPSMDLLKKGKGVSAIPSAPSDAVRDSAIPASQTITLNASSPQPSSSAPLPKSSDVSKVATGEKPTGVAPQKPAAVSSLPAIDVAAPASVAHSDVATATPSSSSYDVPPDSDSAKAGSVGDNYVYAPEEDVVKIMRPSRYSSRK